jgi:hypothetical protein
MRGWLELFDDVFSAIVGVALHALMMYVALN